MHVFHIHELFAWADRKPAKERIDKKKSGKGTGLLLHLKDILFNNILWELTIHVQTHFSVQNMGRYETAMWTEFVLPGPEAAFTEKKDPLNAKESKLGHVALFSEFTACIFST